MSTANAREELSAPAPAVRPCPCGEPGLADDLDPDRGPHRGGKITQELGGAGGVAGGGEVYRDMFTKEVAKMISRSGGIGVADVILQEMLKTQEIG